MNDSKQLTPTLKRRRWPRVLAVAAGILVLLVVAGYSTVTSSAFFKAFILPRVGKALNASVTAGSAVIRPFSQVVLGDVQVTPTGSVPLFTAKEIKVRYGLRAILGGVILVHELTIDSPVIEVVQTADGKSNLGPVLDAVEKMQAGEDPKAATKPPVLDINQVSVRNATVRLIQTEADGSRSVTELTGFSAALDSLKNGQSGKLTVDGAIQIDRGSSDSGPRSKLSARTAANLVFKLTDDLLPETLKGDLVLTVGDATGVLSDLAATEARLDCDLTPTEFKDLAVRFKRANVDLGEVHVRGPFDFEKKEGNLTLVILPLDRRALNLIGAPLGMDFGTTTIQSTNRIQITAGAAEIRVRGRLDVANFAVTRLGKTTPALNIEASYDVIRDSRAAPNGLRSADVSGRVVLPEFTGSFWGYQFNQQGFNADFDIGMSGSKITFRKASGSLSDRGRSGGKFELSGDYDTSAGEGNVKLGLTDVNQMSLRPFLEPHLGGKTLESVSLNAAAALQTQANGGGTVITGEFKVANLVVRAAGNTAPVQPIEIGARLDAVRRGSLIEIRSSDIRLTPTARSKNEVQVTGKIDLSRTNVIQGGLKVAAESLDATAYFDLVAADSGAKPSAARAPAPAPGQAKAVPTEPPAMELPFRDFTAELGIGRLYLRELDIADWKATLKLDGGRVLLNPFEMSLNGSPIRGSADLDLGVPGYRYEIKLKAEKVPLEPIANSFSPEYRGRAKGELYGDLAIKGAGTLGVNLREHLDGRIGVRLTNATVQLAGPKMKVFLSTLALALRLDELSEAPLSWLSMDARAGGGSIHLDGLVLQTAAFSARSQGVIPIAPELLNSPVNSFPIEIGLRRALAEKVNLVPGNTPTNAIYVPLPNFASAGGTLGDVSIRTDKLALTGMTARSLGASGLIGGDAGKILEGVGNLLGGQPSSGTNTNQGGKSPPAFNPLDLFRKLK